MTRRRAVAAIIGLFVLLVIALAGIGWYYSNQLRQGALIVDHSPEPFDLQVAAVGNGEITLKPDESADKEYGAWRSDGLWGLDWSGGYAEVGAIVGVTDDQVVRKFTTTVDEPAVGTPARLDSFYYDGDPNTALGLSFDEVKFDSGGAQLAAWYMEGDRDTWAIFTHGHASSRQEALRALPTFASMGFPSLVITYRNDEDAPRSEDGYYNYGATEWQDLEAAVRYALANGASHVVLVGYSMGGGITASFLYNSDLAGYVSAVVLDAPMLDFGDVINYGAERRGYPGFLTTIGKFVAGLRFGIDWNALDYLSRADELSAPILLFHGDADRTVHIRTSEALAAMRPDIVTYVRVPGATHVRAWNMGPDAYSAALESFLSKAVPLGNAPNQSSGRPRLAGAVP